MIKKLTLTIFLLTFTFLVQTAAQTEVPTEKQIAVKELVALMNADNKAEEIMNMMTTRMQASQDANAKSMLDSRTDLTATERKSLEDALVNDKKYSYKRFYDKLMQKLNFNELINEAASTAYNKYYTLEEIKDLTSFFKTPTGQKSLKLTTAIGTDTMQMMQERMLPKIKIVIKEIEDENKLEIEQKINAVKPKPKKLNS